MIILEKKYTDMSIYTEAYTINQYITYYQFGGEFHCFKGWQKGLNREIINCQAEKDLSSHRIPSSSFLDKDTETERNNYYPNVTPWIRGREKITAQRGLHLRDHIWTWGNIRRYHWILNKRCTPSSSLSFS